MVTANHTHQLLIHLHAQRHVEIVRPTPADFGGALTEAEIQIALADLTQRDFISSHGKLTIRGSLAVLIASDPAAEASQPKATITEGPAPPADTTAIVSVLANLPAETTDAAQDVFTAAEAPPAQKPAAQEFDVICHTPAAAPKLPNPELKFSPNNLNQTKTNNMAQSIKPLGARVLVKRVEAEEKTAGGLFIPDNAKEKPQEAEVIELGTGGRDDEGKEIPFNVKKGDLVLISKYGGTEVKVDGNDLLIISESDILGIVTK